MLGELRLHTHHDSGPPQLDIEVGPSSTSMLGRKRRVLRLEPHRGEPALAGEDQAPEVAPPRGERVDRQRRGRVRSLETRRPAESGLRAQLAAVPRTQFVQSPSTLASPDRVHEREVDARQVPVLDRSGAQQLGAIGERASRSSLDRRARIGAHDEESRAGVRS
ncbi:MAG: hypothetical protein AB7G37_20625 [Solirubrobacteraceae bacterium]